MAKQRPYLLSALIGGSLIWGSAWSDQANALDLPTPFQPNVALAPAPDPTPTGVAADDPDTTPESAVPILRPADTSRDLPLSAGYLTSAAALAPRPQPAVAIPALPKSSSPTLAQLDPEESENSETPDLENLDPELGIIQVRGLQEDNDLGVLRIRDQPQFPLSDPQPPAAIGFLQARLAITSSDNILLAVNDVGGLTGDVFLRPSVTLAVYPPLGPQTSLLGTVDVGLQRYVNQSSLNYDDLRFRLGIRQGLTPRSYGQLVVGYQTLFRPGGNRFNFFDNTSLGLTLARQDPLASNLFLDTYYQVQYNGVQARFQTPTGMVATDFSRIFQSAGGYLGYTVTPQLQAGISYQLNLVDYTVQDRYDTFQLLLGQLIYRITPTVRMSLYGGVSFGRSSEPRVQFNDVLFGASVEANLPLF